MTPSSGGGSPTEPAHVVPDVVKADAKGTKVRELQQRLFQLAWLPETTTGVYDLATVGAVKGFQAKHGLRPTGVVDIRTWRRLSDMTATPSHDAMFNVLHAGAPLFQAGAHARGVRAIQARLRQISWYFGDVTGSYDAPTVTAVKGFQAKRVIPVTGAVDQRTLDRLEAMTTTPLEVTDGMVAELRRSLDDAQLVELTMMISVENSRSRFNSALGLSSQGFRDRCEIPAR